MAKKDEAVESKGGDKSADQIKKEKLAKLSAFQESMAKKYGDEALIVGNQAPNTKVDTVSTGAVSLDIAIGVGGFPRGRIIEIYGPEASGKTTLSLQAIANAQKAGGNCAFIDVEQALDVTYAKQVGVKFNESLNIMSPSHGEEALDMLEAAIQSGAFDVVVLDSVAALVPQKELEGEMGDQQMGLQARMMGKICRKITPAAKQNNVLVIFINQTREKIGVMYGSPETTAGGNALKFYASLRLRVRKASGEVKSKIDGVVKDGYKMVVKIVKNKLNSPQEDIELPIIYGVGVDAAFDLFNAAKALEVISVNGRTYTFGEKTLATSADKALDAVREDAALQKAIEKEVRKKLAK